MVIEEMKRPERVQAAFEVWRNRDETGPNENALFEYIETLEYALLTGGEPVAWRTYSGGYVHTSRPEIAAEWGDGAEPLYARPARSDLERQLAEAAAHVVFLRDALGAENKSVWRDAKLSSSTKEAAETVQQWIDDALNELATEAARGDALAIDKARLEQLLTTSTRNRFYYPTVMPLDKDGNGPASEDRGEVRKLTWEVWDREHGTHGSFEHLPDAIDKANELNAVLFATFRAETAEAVGKAGGWKPIETVPKDGTVIDLWHEEFGRQPDCYWGAPHHECGEAGQYCDSEWHGAPDGWVDSTLNQSTFDDGFTHWMPKPAGPDTVRSTLMKEDGR